MQSTFGRGLAAGLAAVAFVAAAAALSAEFDRVAASLALIGLALLSVAILSHIVEPRND
jgi:hypothetical protein